MSNKWIVYRHISPSNKVYVGITSIGTQRRWGKNGRNYLKNNQPLFANAILKYGWDNFIHEIILEGISESHAKYTEKYLIKWYKTHNMSYNITDGGDGLLGVISSNKGKFGKDCKTSRLIFQYDLDGNFICKWYGASDAARHLGNKGKATNIIRAAKTKDQAFGYYWSREYTESFQGNPLHKRSVGQYNSKTFQLIRVYQSVKQASKSVNISSGDIIRSCKGKKGETAKGFIWQYITLDTLDSYG